MPIKVLEARHREADASFVFTFHLDTTRLTDAGDPDPAWVETYAYTAVPPKDAITADDWKTTVTTEAKALARARRDELAAAAPARRQRGAGVKLPDEGKNLP